MSESERPPVDPLRHPHDGYSYIGCDCVCCVNVRALATALHVACQPTEPCSLRLGYEDAVMRAIANILPDKA